MIARPYADRHTLMVSMAKAGRSATHRLRTQAAVPAPGVRGDPRREREIGDPEPGPGGGADIKGGVGRGAFPERERPRGTYAVPRRMTPTTAPLLCFWNSNQIAAPAPALDPWLCNLRIALSHSSELLEAL